MKTLLCYGDSNTWGYAPSTNSRYSLEKRWPSVLAERLGSGYLVIAEGLGGRTTVWEDPIETDRNGASYLLPCLHSHKPLDLVVIMLGTNDLKRRFSLGAGDIAAGACRLGLMARKSETGVDEGAPAVLLVCPPPILEVGPLAGMFEGGAATSAGLAAEFRRLAAEAGLPLLVAGDFVESSPLDGIHFAEAAQRTIGERVAEWVSHNLH
jgi:lysophospholipase L1-like esterase